MKKQLLELLPSLRRFSLSLTNSPHDADDLLQSTVERLLSRGVPEDAELSRWAFTVCRNLWIDEFRARKVRRAAEWDPTLEPGPAVDGEREAHARMELERVNAAMLRLPEDQHLVLSMVAVQGLPYKRVAEELGLPLGTVMSRLARARARVAEFLNAGEKTSTGDAS